MEQAQTFFPIFINLDQKHCILYGGGNIACRRAEGLLRFGAKVTVYAPRIGAGICRLKEEYPQTLLVEQAPYRPGISEADFVFSCTDDAQTDRAVYEECKARGIPVNIASDQQLCDFLFPALAVQEELVVGISSGGKNHKKVRQFSQKLREWMGGCKWK